MGLLRTLAILIISYYIFKFITRYIAPIFLRRMMRNMSEKIKRQQQDQYTDQSGTVGETVIDKKPSGSKNRNNQVGDYVDYEEVND